MARVRCSDVQARPTECLDGTRLPLDAFQHLLPPCAAAFPAPLATWGLDGTPRTARQFAVDHNWPLPTPADRLLFILAYVHTSSLQVVPGRRCGRGQSKAHPCIHVLLPGLRAALRALGDAPARSLPALAQRRGGSEAAAATGGAPLEEAPAPVVAVPAVAPASPLLPMTARHGAASAPKALLNRPHVLAARKRLTPSKLACESLRCAASSSSAPPMAAVSMTGAWPTRPRSPSPHGAGGYRRSACWPSRSPRSRASGPPRHPGARRYRWRSTRQTRRSTSGGGALSPSTVVSSAAVACRTASVWGKKASVLW